MNRYDTNTKGTSPALSQLQNDWQKMPRSSFDLTRRKTFDAYPFAIIPFECGVLFPNTDVNVSYDLSIITKNPTIRRMLSSVSAEISVYKVNNNDCWEGWNNFITRGRSGNVSLEIPHLDWKLGTTGSTTAIPYNPAHYLNIAPAVFYSNSETNKWDFAKNTGLQSTEDLQVTGLTGISTLSALAVSEAMKISALPFVFYAKIAKEFQNANLLQDNSAWYPVNENHDLLLPYASSGTAVSCASYDTPQRVFGSSDSLQPTNDSNSAPWLNVLYYKMRRGDYFNTGSPFPDLLRGDVPTLDVLNAQIDWSDLISSSGEYASGIVAVTDKNHLGLLKSKELGSGYQNIGIRSNNNYFTSSPIWTSNGYNILVQNVSEIAGSLPLTDILSKAKISGIQFSMNEWRKLAVETVFRERLARTDGSYNKMIEAMFGHNPRWHNHDVTYCGGSTQQIVFSEVVQTSADNSASPLGTTAGRAVSAQQNGTIRIHSDDFGMYMAVLTLTPDTYYSQGVDRQFAELTESEMYFPIRNNLAPQATLNRELYVSGTDSDDMDVFNYQERYAHFKSRQNQISGMMSLPISQVGDVGAYVMNRLFTGTPQFNQQFVQGDLTDNEDLVFASTTQAQFVCTIISRMHLTGPLPAISQPADMGISY